MASLKYLTYVRSCLPRQAGSLSSTVSGCVHNQGGCLNTIWAPGAGGNILLHGEEGPRTKRAIPCSHLPCLEEIWTGEQLPYIYLPFWSFSPERLSHGSTMSCMSPWEISWSDVFTFTNLSLLKLFISRVFILLFFFFRGSSNNNLEKNAAIETKLFSFWGTQTPLLMPPQPTPYPVSSLQVTALSLSFSCMHALLHSIIHIPSPWDRE